MGIEIGHVVEEWTGDDGERDELMAYVKVSAKLDGKPISLGTMVGVQPYQHGTVRAAGSGVGPFLSTWWEDASDWQDVPSDRRAEAEDELAQVTRRLWHEVQAMRGADR